MKSRRQRNKKNSNDECEELRNEIKALQLELNNLRKDEEKLNESRKLSDEEEEKLNKYLLQDETKLKYDMFRLSGIICKSYDDDGSEFIFPAFNEDGSETNYYVKIVNEGEQGTVEKYIMPSNVNIPDLLTIAPINKRKNLPDFLNLCRHHILIFQDRKRQLQELKDQLKGVTNCEAFSDKGLMHISIRFINVHNMETDKVYHFDANLFYVSNIRLPSRFTVSPVIVSEKTVFSEVESKKLIKIFAKPFKKLELSEAFDEFLKKNKHPFVWDPNEELESTVEHNEIDYEDNSNSDSIDEFLIGMKPKRKNNTSTVKNTKVKGKNKVAKSHNVSKENISIKDGNKQKQRKGKKRNKSYHEEEIEPSFVTPSQSNNGSVKKRKKLDPKQKTLNFTRVMTDVETPTLSASAVIKLKKKRQSQLNEMKAKTSNLLVNKHLQNNEFSNSTPLRNSTRITNFFPDISQINPNE